MQILMWKRCVEYNAYLMFVRVVHYIYKYMHIHTMDVLLVVHLRACYTAARVDCHCVTRRSQRQRKRRNKGLTAQRSQGIHACKNEDTASSRCERLHPKQIWQLRKRGLLVARTSLRRPTVLLKLKKRQTVQAKQKKLFSRAFLPLVDGKRQQRRIQVSKICSPLIASAWRKPSKSRQS